MTIISAPDLYNVVDAPIGVPYRYGLDSVVDFGGDVHDLNGITWVGENCPTVGQTTSICFDPTVDPIDFGLDQCNTPEFKPFTVYLPLAGSLGGGDDTERARRLLTLGENYGAELAFSDYLASSVTETAITVTGSPFDKLSTALAFVEQAILDGSKVEPVVHMSRFAASILSVQLTTTASGLRTALGTKVAAYGGWIDGYPATDSIFATGPIKGIRGPIDTINTPNRANNSNSIIAARTYVLGFDCAAVGASVTL